MAAWAAAPGAYFLVSFDLLAQPLGFGAARRARAQIPEDLKIANAHADAAKTPGPAHLRLEFGNPTLELGDQIANADCVLLGAFEAAHRFVLAGEKLPNARRLFEERTTFDRLARENGVDLALRDDCVGSGAEAGAG